MTSIPSNGWSGTATISRSGAQASAWRGSADAHSRTPTGRISLGDDTWGLLWFLDPDQAYDDEPDAALPVQQIEFERVISAQVVASGRQAIPCYALFLSGDNYGLTAIDFTPSITLEMSDDQGRNFDTFETLTVEPDLTVLNPYQWLSLGDITQPGRIFRFTDTGFSRGSIA
jgi:hypothetical protein